MGEGSGQMGSCRCVVASRRPRHLEIQVDILAVELSFEFFIRICGLQMRDTGGGEYLDFETAILHRISILIYLASWFGLESHVVKINWVCLVSRTPCPCFRNMVPAIP